MSDIKKNKPAAHNKPATAHKIFEPLFTKENYLWMGIGAAIIILAMFLMSGGKNQNPNVFDDNVTYSFRRITLAPILFITGILVEVYAIFKKSKKAAE